MPESTVVTSEGPEQHPRWVPFILGPWSSQHKHGVPAKGELRAWRAGPEELFLDPTFSGTARRAEV